ncbi:MAG TPA: CHAT domain-containing tetratricopeptide repeat protein [Bryobacteraceae bacterium]|nr:CHAT domain-containing tetratricopeptide repeat protein [Bryobacteraceae bacterium]
MTAASDLEHLCLQDGGLNDASASRVFLSVHPELLQPSVVRRLAEAVRAAVRVDVQKAMALAEAAVVIAAELDDEEALAWALRAKANALWLTGDCRSAVELFRRAADLFEHSGNMNEVGRTLSSSLQSLGLLGEYDMAIAAAERAREIFDRTGDKWRIARLDINVANLYHRQNRFWAALAAYERAYCELVPHKDMEGIGAVLHNMAVCLIALDDFPRALETYQRVREFCEQHEMPLVAAQADYNIAYLYQLRGDYTKALALLHSTRGTFHNNGDNYHLALCDLDQSDIYLELRLIKEASVMAQSSFERFERRGMGFELARSLTNLAIAKSLVGRSIDALELFSRAKVTMCRERNQAWPFLIDIYSALVLLNQGSLAEAQELAVRSAEFFRNIPLPSKYVFCLLVLTRISLYNGNTSDSARYCSEALETLEGLDWPALSYEAQFLRGQIHEAEHQPEQAYDAYQAARSLLETVRFSLQKPELKIGFLRNRLEVYERLIQLCLDRIPNASSEEALCYIEAAKSRTLQDLIIGGGQPVPETPEDTENDRQIRDLRKQLNWYYHRIENEQLSEESISEKRVSDLKEQAVACERRLEQSLLEAPNSSVVARALHHSSATTLERIRGALGPDATLIEYFSIRQCIFASVVTSERVEIVRLAPASSVMQRLRMLQFQLSKFRLSQDYVTRFESVLIKTAQFHLNALFEAVFAPLQRFLTTRDLVVVPHGPLHSIPFDALFDGRNYVLDRFTLCYAPSASIFVHCCEQSDRRSGPSLILGVEDQNTPFIGEEVRAVASAVPEPQVLVGPQATEEALRKQGRDSRLIHIATHGYFRQDSPMFSAIRLSDSYVNLYDLYRMNLPVDLLAMSGCVTGLNVIDEGDELLGLTRGLLYAGARSLLLSLWDVGDRSTADLMRNFYARLQTEPRKAVALRAAMLNQREQNPHPYYWAPFKLIGKGLTF